MIRRPGFRITDVSAMSEPFGRIHAPGSGSRLMITVPSSFRVRSSIITIASAHDGTGAPVIIRAASPSIPLATSTESPARSSPASLTGLPAFATERPEADNTTPSRAELLNGGIDNLATAGSASIRPTASSNGTNAVGINRREARSSISPYASSIEINCSMIPL